VSVEAASWALAHGHRLDTSRSQCAQVLGRIGLQREHPD